MKKLGLVFAVLTTLTAALFPIGRADAAVPLATAALLERTVQNYQTISTPPQMSLDQRRLLSVTLAAAELQTTDPDAILYAYQEAEALVTYLLQSDTSYAWEDPPGAWVPESRSTYTYSGNNISEIVTQIYDQGVWTNSAKLIYTYSNGRVATSTNQTWSGSAWVNSFKITYTYNGSGFMTESLFQNWDGLDWVNFLRTTNSYVGNKLDSSFSYSWDGSGSTWENSTRSAYTYNGELLATTTTQMWAGTIWMNSSRISLTYNGTLVSQTITETWDFLGNDWQNAAKSESTYDGTNQILNVSYLWQVNAWVAQDADTTHYSGNRPIRSVDYNIQTTALDQTLYYYNGEGSLVEVVDQFWSGSAWVNDLRDAYVYIAAGVFDDGAAEAMPATFTLAQNYPNPFNLATAIPYSLAGDRHVKITVSNILGQTISTIVDEFQLGGSHTAAWEGHDANGREVASGIYFFRVQVDDAAQVRKMVLLK